MKHRWLGPWRASFDSCTNALCPRQDIAELLNAREPIFGYGFLGRVPGEAAHDLAEATVAKFGGRMLTQHAPVPPAEAGVVY